MKAFFTLMNKDEEDFLEKNITKCLFILRYIIQTIVSLSEIWGLVKKADPRNQHISHDHKTQEKRFQTSSHPKNNILPSWKKKNLTAEKTTTYGWVGCEQKECSYHIWTFPLQTWGKGKFCRRECRATSKPLFWKHNWGWETAETVLFQVSYGWEPGIEFHLWPQHMLKRMKAENPGFIRGFVSRTPWRLKQREEWNVLEHAYSQHQSPSVPIITLGCHHYVPRIWVSFEPNRISFKHTSLLGISAMWLFHNSRWSHIATLEEC